MSRAVLREMVIRWLIRVAVGVALIAAGAPLIIRYDDAMSHALIVTPDGGPPAVWQPHPAGGQR